MKCVESNMKTLQFIAKKVNETGQLFTFCKTFTVEKRIVCSICRGECLSLRQTEIFTILLTFLKT